MRTARKPLNPRSASKTTVLTVVEGNDRSVASRVRTLLESPDIEHLVSTRRKLRPDMAEISSLLLVVAGTDIDWTIVAELAHRVDTVVLVNGTSRSQARRALAAGATGYLDLSMKDETLKTALLAVLSGEAAFSRSIIGEWLRSRRTAPILMASAKLTPRQRQILERIAHGDTDKQIAEHLGIAVATAHKHVQNLLHRLKVPNRAAAVMIASGLVLKDETSRERSA
jgi:two-component system nitrate/nitrite response regulator NarL